MGERVTLRGIDGFAVDFNPTTHLLKQVTFKRHHAAITTGADVEQVVASPADHPYQALNLLLHLRLQLSPQLPGAVSPRLVEHRCRCLPRHYHPVIGILIVAHHAEVHKIIPQPPADHAVWLQTVYQLVETPALLRRERSHIEPYLRDITVAGHDLLHLQQVIAVVLRRERVGIVTGDRVCLWVVPVDQ